MSHTELEMATLGDIVTRDFRAGAILDRYGLDYCCGGARKLADGCAQRGVDIQLVLRELEALDPGERETPDDDPAALIEYILSRHHRYVRQMSPVIRRHLAKVVAVHGERHPELRAVDSQFGKIAEELALHMMKEEQVLFPHIVALVDSATHNASPPPDIFGTIQNPIRMMEIEHAHAGDGLAAVHELTHGYQPPADACSTPRLVFEELEAFEHDLHQHVHLENNILFPKAVELESRVARLGRGLKSQEQ